MLNPDVIINSQPLGRKILELHPDSGHEHKNQKEKWFLMSNNETESDEIEEVYWKGNTVAVLSFDKHQNDFRLKNSFSVETEIKDVIYTDFHLDEKSSELSQCLCVLEKSCLNIFTEVGKLFIASLPFKVKKIWGISKGICAEREANSKDAEEEKGMPTLFSLAHPMEDFKPVVYHYLDNRKPMYFTDATQHIVFTSPKDSLIMTYDSVLGLHSVWKARKALEQDFPEVLSHQDSLPEFGMMNQSSQLGALKGGPGITGRFSMSPSVTTSNKRHSCPPIPIHLQQKGTPGASSSPMSRKGFSPAGHLHKGSPHHHLHANSHHHEAHESSYVSEINGSKRSHMNSLMMFRMSCADTRLEEEAEPLPPNLCLEQVWQEQTTTIRYGLKGKSVFCFMSTDFNGISYLGYLVKGLSKLKLLKIHYGKFEKATEIECMDAGPLQPLKMYVVMDLSQNLHLYTGKQKVMSVCLPQPLQGVELGTLNLNQFVNGGFNISCCNNSERSARLQIPPLCQSDLGKLFVAYFFDKVTKYTLFS
ncbi:anaphase-promoting complex subunit 1-like [Clytia hemisphaerica]